MLKIWIGIAIILSGISATLAVVTKDRTVSSSTSQYNQYISKYTECMNSPNTRFMAGMHHEKYPNVSIRQISHILCKDAK